MWLALSSSSTSSTVAFQNCAETGAADVDGLVACFLFLGPELGNWLGARFYFSCHF